MNLRAPFFVLLACIAWAAPAQDWDVYLSGIIRDAGTLDPVPFARIEATGQNDLSNVDINQGGAVGAYLCQLYSGRAYRVEFRAPGYITQAAVIDLEDVDKGGDATLAWRILMDIALQPVGASDGAAQPLLGTCQWDSLQHTLAWTETRLHKVYPVERYNDERIAVHGPLIDSLWAKGGMLVDGVVTEHWSAAHIANAELRVTAPGYDTLCHTDRFGYYATLLKKKAIYRLEFSREGMVTKRVDMDLTTLPEQDTTLSYHVALDIRLFQNLPNEDLAFLKEPMGIMRYSPVKKNMTWDMNYSGPILLKLEKILSRYNGPPALRR